MTQLREVPASAGAVDAAECEARVAVLEAARPGCCAPSGSSARGSAGAEFNYGADLGGNYDGRSFLAQRGADREPAW